MKKKSPVPLVVEDAEHHAAEDQHVLPRSSASFSRGGWRPETRKFGRCVAGKPRKKRREGTTPRWRNDGTRLDEYSALGHSAANIRQK